jgi:hypothetical protein
MQPARKQLRPSEAPPPKTLTQQFEESCAETWRLADELVRLRAVYEKSCAPGLPMEVILQELPPLHMSLLCRAGCNSKEHSARSLRKETLKWAY